MVRALKSFLFAGIVLAAASGVLCAQPVSKSTIDDQIRVEVTVYNSNLGLVKDARKVTLAARQGELQFMDVASSIMPVTVHAKSVSDPGGFNVLEQNYEYDLMSSDKLLDKYIGEEVKLIEWTEFQGKKDTVQATLLSNNNGPIYKINNEIYLGYPGAIRVLPKIPENLIAKPTLTWLYDNRGTEPHELEVSYLTNDINWKADYVLVLNQNDTASDLSGWVTVDNKSGATYKKAKLKLVAGDIHRISEYGQGGLRRTALAMYEAEDLQFKEKSFFEYHIYDLQRNTTVKDSQTKQIALLEVPGVGIQKEFLVYGVQSYFTRQYLEGNPKQPVAVYVKFKNSKDNHLGMPLPAGTMRLYKKDDDESLQFVGEDAVKHTPKDEEVRLKIGEAFDVVAERIQKDYKRISDAVHESEWEITLRNHKEEDITVGIIEPLHGSWKIVTSSHPYQKADAFTIRFDVPVPKGKEVKVTYRIKVSTLPYVVIVD